MAGIKNRLRLLMAQKNITTIKELSEKSKVSRQTIDKLVKNKSKRIDVDTVYKLCSVLDCDISELIEIQK